MRLAIILATSLVVVRDPYFVAPSRIQRYEVSTGAVENIPAVQ